MAGKKQCKSRIPGCVRLAARLETDRFMFRAHGEIAKRMAAALEAGLCQTLPDAFRIAVNLPVRWPWER